MTKHQTKNKDAKHNFLQKGKWIWYCLLYLLSQELMGCYKEIDSSNIQEIFFICLKIFTMQWRKNTRVEKRQKKKTMNLNYILKISKFCVMRLTQNWLNIVVRSCCSKRFLCGIHCFKISIRDSVSQFNEV